MAKKQSDIETVENEERNIPSDVEELFETSHEEWLDDLEWEERLRELEKMSDQEKEKAERIEELVFEGLANELDDVEEVTKELDELRQLESDRAEKLAEHFTERPREVVQEGRQ